ncbi:glycosyltransferase family protein [Kocuria marina]|uniref:glycosyltransferase family protein n=1 Tax=Kocuria marina TaxID=223184 RepID=UPI0022E1A340|nr:glycosyltransferase [Kocuria marina]
MHTGNQSQELRITLYSHDSLGLGHTRRNLAIAQALSDALPELTGRRLSGLLITGERTATSYRCPEGFDWLVVPGIRKRTGHYEARHMRVRSERLFKIRSSVIGGALNAFRPHIVIVDRHPLGIDGELIKPLKHLKAVKPETTLVLGLREVLDTPDVAAAEWQRVGVASITDLFDRIWVYGDRDIHDPVATGELPAQFAPMIEHTGLLASGRKFSGRHNSTVAPFVLTMLGGGSDGADVARAAAAAPVPDGVQHLVVTGPQMPAARRREVEAAAGPATKVTNKVSDGMSYVASAEALVSMAGYNTVAETLSTNTPALLVPRTTPRTEQIIRARGLGATGAVDWIEPARASAQMIGQWLSQAVSDPAVASRQSKARAGLRLDGLDRVVELAVDLAWLTDKSTTCITCHHTFPAGGVDHAAV